MIWLARHSSFTPLGLFFLTQTAAAAATAGILFDGNEQMQRNRQPVSNRLMKSNFWSREMHTIGKSSLMATPRIYRLIFIRYLYASNSLKHRTRSLPSCPTNKNLFIICSFFVVWLNPFGWFCIRCTLSSALFGQTAALLFVNLLQILIYSPISRMNSNENEYIKNWQQDCFFCKGFCPYDGKNV